MGKSRLPAATGARLEMIKSNSGVSSKFRIRVIRFSSDECFLPQSAFIPELGGATVNSCLTKNLTYT
jgi:hypothetical protein